jgi:hypothetical protein
MHKFEGDRVHIALYKVTATDLNLPDGKGLRVEVDKKNAFYVKREGEHLLVSFSP